MTIVSAPGAPIARLVRAASVSLWATLMAVAAHVAGSGEPPPAVAVVPVVVAGGALAWWASARRIGFVTALGLLAAPQVAVHLLAGYVHGHQVVPGPSMAVAHVLGLVLVAAGIAVAERLWWAWWQRVSFVLRLGHARAVPARVPLPCLTTGPVSRVRLLEHVVVRRGPPASWVVIAPVARPCG